MAKRVSFSVDSLRYKNRPCADCHVQYPPYVMDCDHVRGEKCFNISNPPSGTTPQEFQNELEKCDVVCANCHRMRTHKDSIWHRLTEESLILLKEGSYGIS